MAELKIGDVAKQTGMTVKSIRYYHDIGLVCAKRNDVGYRVYQQSDVATLSFIHHCRDLGFSIEDCKTLTSLKHNQSRSAEEVKQLATAHLLQIESRIKNLTTLKQQLEAMIHDCQGGSQPDCAILSRLSEI